MSKENKKSKVKIKTSKVEAQPTEGVTSASDIRHIGIRLSTGQDLVGLVDYNLLQTSEHVVIINPYLIITVEREDGSFIALLQQWFDLCDNPMIGFTLNPIHVLTTFQPNQKLTDLYSKMVDNSLKSPPVIRAVDPNNGEDDEDDDTSLHFKTEPVKKTFLN